MSTESGLASWYALRTPKDVAVDLSWINLLKGLAIVGVFLDNWTLYLTPRGLGLGAGTFVQVFFVVSGFGLATDYFRHAGNAWSWRRWAWRRVVKIILPYQIAVALSFALGIVGSLLYSWPDVKFSLADYLAHVTLTQNIFPTSHVWNSPLWFMPVIVGLYFCLPFLLAIVRRFGRWWLVGGALAATYVTLAIASASGLHRGHATDLFAFWLFQFALGIALAHLRLTRPEELRALVGYPAFLVGVAFLVSSWAVRTYLPHGRIFNDAVTSVGIFLVLLNIIWLARARIPLAGESLRALGTHSYPMYLVHVPIMQSLVGPLLLVPMSPVLVVTLGLVYTLLVFVLVRPLSRSMDRFTTVLSGKAAR